MKSKTYFKLILLTIVFSSSIYTGGLDHQMDNLNDISTNPQSITTDKKNIEKLKNLRINALPDKFSTFDLSIVFNEASASVDGNVSLELYNNDDISYDRIPFHLYLAGMQYDERPGSFEIYSVSRTDPTIEDLNYEITQDDQILWLTLNEALPPDSSISLDIDFKAFLPDGGIDRANFHGSDENQTKIFKFAHFYPIPAVYDNSDGWNNDSYLSLGDPFYFDMGHYTLDLELPKDMVVAASGTLINSIEHSNTITYTFSPTEPVREVTFSVSRYFIQESKIFNGINISSYFLPVSKEFWSENSLEFGINSIELFSQTFGEYPYNSFNIVEEHTHYGGMEYPCQVYISGDYPNYIEAIIVHETAHQWWYNLVHNDEVDQGFLDEGLVEWSTGYYAEKYYNSWDYFQGNYPYLKRVRFYYSNYEKGSKINQSIYEFMASDMDYWFVAYRKTPVILQKLRFEMGNQTFINALKTYFNEFKFNIVFLSDFQAVMEKSYGASLDWFFQPWFNNDYLPKYEFSNVKLGETWKLNFTIRDINSDLHEYQYAQRIPCEIYDIENNLVYNNSIWVNGTSKISIDYPKMPKPKEIRLIYNDFILVQLEDNQELFIRYNFGSISGYEFTYLLISISFIISLIFLRLKVEYKRIKPSN